MTNGLIGLGNMGSELARNLVISGIELVTHDIAGDARNPAGATFVTSLTELAASAEVVTLSLPDGAISARVIEQLVGAPVRAVRCIIDTSTVGISAAQANAATAEAADVAFIDAAVSGGPTGARTRTLTVMFSGADDACEAAAPTLAAISDNTKRVGVSVGLAQAVKLANNYMSAAALAATSEAISFCQSVGVDMAIALDIFNASSGQSAASSDKFVNHVLTQRYASGFANTLMAKDVSLYLAEVLVRRTAHTVGDATGELWQRFAAQEPGVDFTRIYPFVDRTRGADR